MHARIFALLCLAALLLSGCTQSSGLPSPMLNVKGQKDAALATACRANMKSIYSAEQAYRAEHEAFVSLDELEQSYGKLPKEPGGGTYSIDTQIGRVTCSAGHGSEPAQ